MALPRPLTHMHKFPNCPNPIWQVSPMTDAERVEVKAILSVLEQRLKPATPSAACKLVTDAIRTANPAAIDDSSAAWIAALVAGYSLNTLAASLKFCGVSDLNALADDLRRRRDNAIIYRYRCRVLLGDDLPSKERLQPQWYEIPGAPCPNGPDKPFDKPVF